MSNKPITETEYDSNSLDADEALRRILSTVQPIDAADSVDLHHALDRVLANDVLSPINVPAYDNSAMDGFALRHSDVSKNGKTKLRIVGKSLAGHPFKDPIESGQAIRIMTGAQIPEGADAIVMQEQVSIEGEYAIISDVPKVNQHVRRAGEDLAAGQVALQKGRRISPADLGLAASLGISQMQVVRRARVVFFSTGDELRSVGEPLSEGQIYDSNRYTIFGMLKRLDVEIIDLGIIRDDRNQLRDAMTQAASQGDMVITSGGASVGEADHIQSILAELGQVGFWKIAMKPGKPLAFGKIRNAYFFGLPGNPVSSMATFYQFVRPAILKLTGCEIQSPLTVTVKCVTKLKKIPGRVDYQRGVLSRNASGEYVVATTGNQGSHVLKSMSVANCFIVLPIDRGNVEIGEFVDVQPFFGLV